MTVMSKPKAGCGSGSGCTCPECGGLECLCRPRFFAGQLLTEEDLNRLDHYVRARHRLHNLTLHGTGVSGGLKVICDPCGSVKVTKGHAISPCGEDIVVCEDVAVPICDLIARCRKSERGAPDCDPPRKVPGAGDCEALEEEWVLAIKYDEQPTRGVVPLRTAGSSACASCGGGAGCNCKEGGVDACCGPKARTQPKPRGAPATCEPTVICEGYRFCVYRKPEADPPGRDDRTRLFDPDAPLIAALNCCLKLLVAAIPVMPEIGQTDQLTAAQRRELHTFCCKLKANLQDYFRRHPHTNCEVTARLAALRCPDPANAEGFALAFVEALLALLAVWLDAIKQCFCLALLPPAPEPSCDDRIALATVRVTVRDCRVLSICNWTTERDMLLSWPALVYWFGGLSVWDMLRRTIDTLCCTSLLDLFDGLGDDDNRDTIAPVAAGAGFAATSAAMRGAAPAAGPSETGPTAILALRLDQTFARAASSMAVDLPRIDIDAILSDKADRDEAPGLSGLLNAASPRFRFPGRGGPLSAAEREDLPGALTLEFAAKPLLARLFGRGRGQSAAPPASAAARDETLAALRAEVERQRADIDGLKRAMAARNTEKD